MEPGVPFVPSRKALEQAFRGALAADVVLAASEWIRAGNLAAAALLCDIARGSGDASVALDVCEAAARFGLGEHVKGLELVARARRTSPSHLPAKLLEAQMFADMGRGAEARVLLTELITACPDYPGALPLLAWLVMPGPYYRDVLARIHRVLRPDTYLEIGVESGATLALATSAAVAAGVDPAPLPSTYSLPRNARHYCLESDEFFARETRARVFDGKPIELAFIDGMHWFDYALRDFVNVESWAAAGGTILLHDCLSVAPVAALRERASLFWVGDVWKVLEALLDYRPDLRISVIPTAPSGLVVVRGLDPTSRVLSSRMTEILERYRDVEYPYEPARWAERYRVVENDDAGVLRALLA